MEVIQVLDALDYGDGVSNSVINTHKLLNEMNIKNNIYSKWAHDNVKEYRNDFDKFKPGKDAVVLYHFSGYSHIMDHMLKLKVKTVLVYHNVTPPEFFKDTNQEAYEGCLKGLSQIKSNIKKFDFYVGDSEFNKDNLLFYGVKEADVLPIALDLDNLKNKKINSDILGLYAGKKMILAVGRIAPNKKVEDLLDVFEAYYTYIDANSVLLCVGSEEQSKDYSAALVQKLQRLNCRGSVIFTGKVADEDLYGYYRRADAFLCMSEHEGFCLPLIEAMFFDVPVIAYNSCAVPYTMGKSGVLVNVKDPQMISEVLDFVLHDKAVLDKILDEQRKNVELYMNDALKVALKELLTKWG